MGVNLKNIYNIASWEYLLRIRTKFFVISTFIIPALIILGMYLPSLIMGVESDESKVIAIADQSDSGIGMELSCYLMDRYKLSDGRPKFQVMIFNEGERRDLISTCKKLLDSMVISGYLLIPANIFEMDKVKYYTGETNINDIAILENSLNYIALKYILKRAGVDIENIHGIDRKIYLDVIKVSKGGEKKLSSVEFYLIPVIVLFLFFSVVLNSSQMLMRSVIIERSSRLIEVILSIVSPGELMTGKIFGLGLLGLTQTFIYIAVGFYISYSKGFNLNISEVALPIIVYFLLGYLLYSSVFAALGSLFTSEYEAQQSISIIYVIMVLPIMFYFYVITNPYSLLTRIFQFIPFFTPYVMMLKISVGTFERWEFWLTLIILLIFVLISIKIAGKIFRTAILMYGKRPTLSEIIRWLFE